MKRIAIIAGEPSGDLLAARLIKALKQQHPELTFEGIAGQEMQAAGCESLFPMEPLSVMGFAEVIRHLPELLSTRSQLFRRWRENPPDLFIGVDAPDFNLPLAKKLHALGIKTAHYVSPSIWAWREKRVKKIQGNIDLMLTLFPFEVAFYEKYQIPAVFVGHPLADEIEFDGDRTEIRTELNLNGPGRILALLPGSRMGELKRLAPVFLQSAARLQQNDPNLCIVTSLINRKQRVLLESMRSEYAPHLKLVYLEGVSRQLMQAANYILMASGTAVLEGMLSGRLMVAAYRVSGLTWWILQTFRMLKVKYVTLPNHLAGELLVPEILQDELSEGRLVTEVEALFSLPTERREYTLGRFQELHGQLRCKASSAAARAILEHFHD